MNPMRPELGRNPKGSAPINIRDVRIHLLADHRESILQASKLSPGRSAIEIVLSASACIAVIAIGVSGIKTGWWWTAPATILLIAALQHRLSILQHKSIHNLLFGHPALNDMIGLYIIGPSIGAMPAFSRRAHLSHHAHLGTEQDMESAPYQTAPKTRKEFAIWSLLKISGLESAFRLVQLSGHAPGPKNMVPKPTNPPERPHDKSLDWLSLVCVQGSLAAAFALTCGIGYYILFWVAPLLTVTRYLMGIRSMVEHAEKEMVTDPETRFTNTIHCGELEGFFFGPLRFNYHAEHHLFPKVPSWRWPSLKDQFSRHAAFRSVVRVHRSYIGSLAGSLK
jgi:fatty acid desaturase